MDGPKCRLLIAAVVLAVWIPGGARAQTGTPGAPPSSGSIGASGDIQLGSVSNPERQGLNSSVGLDYISGDDLKRLPSTNIADAIGSSTSLVGVTTQQRNAAVTDVRVRGNHTGQLLASGSTWVPARIDLDTAVSKFDTRLLSDIIVIKGPYTARRGPGFSFIDFELLPLPRYDGFGWGGTTSVEYKINGEQVFGREHVWAGGTNWGARVSVGDRAGNDYTDGHGGSPPSSYHSGDLVTDLSYDLSPDQTIEFMYLRSRQSHLEFPSMVYDLNSAFTEGGELKYSNTQAGSCDQLYVEGWYNRSRFQGDTLRPGKAVQIPSLAAQLGGGGATTAGDASSAGYRLIGEWGQPDEGQLTLGTDLLYQTNELNDTDLLNQDFPIPDSHSVDVGLLCEYRHPLGEAIDIKIGGRLDFVATDAQDMVPNLFGAPGSVAGFFGTELDQEYYLWSMFLSSELHLAQNVTATSAIGYGQRPPLLTELYGARPFLGVLQPGLTFVTGDPELDPEQVIQMEFGVKFDYEHVRSRLEFFFGWYRNYITYDHLDAGGGYTPSTDLQNVAYVNTDRATLWGIEWMGEWNMNSRLDAFGALSYLQGDDQSRSGPSRMRSVLGFGPGPRSNTASDYEPLPGMPPLDVRAGLRLHAPSAPGAATKWGLECAVRVVNRQQRVAASLSEFATPGFTTVDLRAHWQATPTLMLLAGVENVGDAFYREHLDLRSGIGTYRTGVNGYFGTEWTY